MSGVGKKDKETNRKKRFREKETPGNQQESQLMTKEREISSEEMVLKHINNVYRVFLPGEFVRQTEIKSKNIVLIKDLKGKKFPSLSLEEQNKPT